MEFLDFHSQVWLATGWHIPVDFDDRAGVKLILQDLRSLIQSIRLRVAKVLPGQHAQFELYLGHNSAPDSSDGE